MKNYGLTDLDFFGFKYTWCNNEKGHTRVCLRLDRVFDNSAWLQPFDQSSVYHLSWTCFVHVPKLWFKLHIKTLNSTCAKLFCFQKFYWNTLKLSK